KRVDYFLVDATSQKIIKYSVPVDIIEDAPGKYGAEPISNLLALGMLEDGDFGSGISLLNNSLFRMFGFPVDRYLVVEEDMMVVVDDIFQNNIDITGLNIREAFLSSKTNLAINELWSFYKFFISLPQDRFITKTITQSYLENLSLLDEELLDITFDSTVSRQKLSFAVLNGTNYAGVANFGSRVIKNLGGRVVATGNAKKIYEKSMIVAQDPNSESVRRVSHAFDIEDVIDYEAGRALNENEILRSDITIIIGLDFAEIM
ncbi:LytR C-terminal domain-containing protein, partial [Patescibacteria group bacterium]|nr:LytR C-terminal domain-containing protein [Patescibacteria group bacterium]